MIVHSLLSALLLLSLLLIGCGGEENGPQPDPVVVAIPIPAGFPPMPTPSNNQFTAERIALGKRLFYDKQISRTREVSCGSCHLADNAFADPQATSLGVEGRRGDRNAPALVNLAWNTSFFWDGGVPTLEQQALAPILNPLEMDMTMTEVVARINADPTYPVEFRAAYGSDPSPEYVTKAIALFVRTLVSGNSRYDRFNRGDLSALTMQERQGMTMFFDERGDCFHCHVGFNLTNNGFANNGMFTSYPDSGRARVTENPRDRGRFKVPTLRNIALTGPYMHDGSIATLQEVLDRYNRGGLGHPNTDPQIHPLNLSQGQIDAIIAFLGTLTDDEFVHNPAYRP